MGWRFPGVISPCMVSVSDRQKRENYSAIGRGTNFEMSGWVTIAYPGQSSVAHSAKVTNANKLNTGPTTGREHRPGSRNSRRSAAQPKAYRMRSPGSSQGTLRGTLLPLGDGHGARR